MVALASLRRQNVIAQAEEITLPLPLKAENVQRFLRSRREEMQRFALRLRFEELPHRAHLHEFSCFLLHLFHAFEKFDGLRVALRKTPFEIASEPHVPPVKHERVDVT